MRQLGSSSSGSEGQIIVVVERGRPLVVSSASPSCLHTRYQRRLMLVLSSKSRICELGMSKSRPVHRRSGCGLQAWHKLRHR